ncbi:MAG: hypothetical protein HY254_08685 [Burkholderiales bacterium]|nr:hypothetical protein [Burkholderiales bacterium]
MNLDSLLSPSFIAHVMLADFKDLGEKWLVSIGLISELEALGCLVTSSNCAMGCAATINQSQPDLLIICSESPSDIRKVIRLEEHNAAIPMIVVLKAPTVQDVVLALNSGADDVVPSSMCSQELASRANAVLRRSGVVAYLADENLEEACRTDGVDRLVCNLNKHLEGSGATVFRSGHGYVIL